MGILELNKLKRGELTTQQIVLLIILILSFIIILYFLFIANFGGESEREVCRNSVVMRGTSGVSADALPLKCSRTYICITENGDCTGMVKPEKIKVKTEEEMYSVLAKEMADCWWMMGEGRVDYIGKDFFFKDNYCSICSQILFDESIANIKAFEKGEISKDKLYDYLATAKKDSTDMTYAEYLLGTNDINSLKQEIARNQSAQTTFGKIYLGRQYYLVSGITSEVSGRGWKIAAGIGASIAGFWFPGTWATWAGLIGGAVIVGAGEYGADKEVEIGAITIKGRGVENEFMSPTIQEANSESFKALNCYEIVSAS